MKVTVAGLGTDTFAAGEEATTEWEDRVTVASPLPPTLTTVAKGNAPSGRYVGPTEVSLRFLPNATSYTPRLSRTAQGAERGGISGGSWPTLKGREDTGGLGGLSYHDREAAQPYSRVDSAIRSRPSLVGQAETSGELGPVCGVC
jgi:hypothetical protein